MFYYHTMSYCCCNQAANTISQPDTTVAFWIAAFIVALLVFYVLYSE